MDVTIPIETQSNRVMVLIIGEIKQEPWTKGLKVFLNDCVMVCPISLEILSLHGCGLSHL